MSSSIKAPTHVEKAVEHIVIVAQIVTIGDDWKHVYSWDGKRHATNQDAADWGWRILDHDDFNIGQVEGNRLVWFGWMEEQHEMSAEDMQDVAEQIGLVA